MVASGVSNLVLSFVLVIPFGLAGVTAATVFAHCLMWLGRAKVVFGGFMRGCGGRYLRVQLCHLATLALCMGRQLLAVQLAAGGHPGHGGAGAGGLRGAKRHQSGMLRGFLRTPNTCAAVRPSCGGASAGRGRNRWQRWAFYTSAPANTRCSGRIFTAPSAKSFCRRATRPFSSLPTPRPSRATAPPTCAAFTRRRWTGRTARFCGSRCLRGRPRRWKKWTICFLPTPTWSAARPSPRRSSCPGRTGESGFWWCSSRAFGTRSRFFTPTTATPNAGRTSPTTAGGIMSPAG